MSRTKESRELERPSNQRRSGLVLDLHKINQGLILQNEQLERPEFDQIYTYESMGNVHKSKGSSLKGDPYIESHQSSTRNTWAPLHMNGLL